MVIGDRPKKKKSGVAWEKTKDDAPRDVDVGVDGGGDDRCIVGGVSAGADTHKHGQQRGAQSVDIREREGETAKERWGLCTHVMAMVQARVVASKKKLRNKRLRRRRVDESERWRRR